MPAIMLDLEVNRVDLVDEGANSESHIKFFKRKETIEPMEFAKILEQMKPEHRQVIEKAIEDAKTSAKQEVDVELQKAKGDLDAATELSKNLQGQLDTLQQEITKSKEPSMEEVIKGLDPKVQEAFKKLNDQKIAAETLAKQLKEDEDKAAAVAKAKELKHLPLATEKLAEVIKGVSDEVFGLLKAANEAIEKGVLPELGSQGDNGKAAADAWAKIESKADEIAKRDSVTKQKAVQIAVRENPELYKEYLDGGAN